MPLVFVHGVATRPTKEQQAEIVQRDALLRAIVFQDDEATILNPDWGSRAVAFSPDLPWLPNPRSLEAFDASGEEDDGAERFEVGLGEIATQDAAQAVDLAVLSALEQAVRDAAASDRPRDAADPQLLELARLAADYVGPHLTDETDAPRGLAELAAGSDEGFADALDAEFEALAPADVEAYGLFGRLRDAVSGLPGLVGNGLSDMVLKRKRRSLSHAVALFLGDIFVYLRERDTAGPGGTATRLFAPILDDLIAAAAAARATREPFVVIGHSLGGVLLYDLLTDRACLARIEAEAPGFAIDLWLTVGSQPGFFADLGLYAGKPRTASGLLARPSPVRAWHNVYDFTDVFSFLCAPFFEDVADFGYDTRVDLIHAHSGYFKRPSFYKRLQLRLRDLGHL